MKYMFQLMHKITGNRLNRGMKKADIRSGRGPTRKMRVGSKLQSKVGSQAGRYAYSENEPSPFLLLFRFKFTEN